MAPQPPVAAQTPSPLPPTEDPQPLLEGQTHLGRLGGSGGRFALPFYLWHVGGGAPLSPYVHFQVTSKQKTIPVTRT